MSKLKITLSPDGEIKMETIGVKGKKCLDYIKLFQKLADVNIKEIKYTDEYNETDNSQTVTENAEIRLD